LSDTTLDNLVKDLNAGAEPKTLALAIKAMADQEMLSKGHGKKVLVEDPFVTFAKGNKSEIRHQLSPFSNEIIHLFEVTADLRSCGLSQRSLEDVPYHFKKGMLCQF
jgi:hypothetical protein